MFKAVKWGKYVEYTVIVLIMLCVSTLISYHYPNLKILQSMHFDLYTLPYFGGVFAMHLFVDFTSRAFALVFTLFVFGIMNRSFWWKRNKAVTKIQKITTIILLSWFSMVVISTLLNNGFPSALFMMIGSYILLDIHLIPVRQHNKQQIHA